MKKITYLALAGLISFTACKKKDPDPPPPAAPKAYVMFGNTSVDVPSATAKVAGTAVSSASNMAFLVNSGYVGIDPVTNAAVAFHSASNLELKATSLTLNANTYYTVFLTGKVIAPEIAYTTDDLSTPSAGKAKIRLLHLSNDTLKLTATVDATTIATGITFKNASSFVEVPAGTWDIVVTDPSPSTIHLTETLSSQKLDAGKIYTIIKTGINGGVAPADYKLTLITNK